MGFHMPLVNYSYFLINTLLQICGSKTSMTYLWLQSQIHVIGILKMSNSIYSVFLYLWICKTCLPYGTVYWHSCKRKISAKNLIQKPICLFILQMGIRQIFFSWKIWQILRKIAIFKISSCYSYIETPSHMGDNSYKNIQITDASWVTKIGNH